MRATFDVRFSYPVHFTRDVLSPANPLLADAVEGERPGQPARVLAAIDAGLAGAQPELPQRLAAYAEAHAGRLSLAGAPLTLAGGEAAKTSSDGVEALWEAIDRRAISRHCYVLAIGGGAFLDVAGYAAATAHRGVRLIRVPTTVLAQNDSGVGVKNGINRAGKKNFVGTFAPPWAVLNDVLALATLPDREWRAGTIEAVKVALLRDEAFFAQLEHDASALAARDLDVMEAVIRRCAQLHVEHIAKGGDPFERGSSRPLDFGHWAAHKLESLSGFELRHGEAVAIGIALDTTYAHLAGLLDRSDWHRTLDLIEALGLPVHTPELSQGSVLDGLEEFREHLGGRLTIALVEGIGRGVEVNQVDEGLVRRAAATLAERCAPAARVACA